MENKKKSLDATFFNALYEQNQDPWNFEESAYERAKYEETLRMIPGENYTNAFEIGCANGLLTSMLKNRCQKLLAVDASKLAVAKAESRMQPYPQVTVKQMEIPNDFPEDKFDLILFSEVGYFLSEDDLMTARDKMIEALTPGGHLLLVHWRPVVAEFPLTGDQVHQIFLIMASPDKAGPVNHLAQKIEEEYRMDLFEKR